MSTVYAQTLAEISRALVLIALVAAAVAKSRDIDAFAGDLSRSFGWLQGASARIVAVAILITEWAIAAVIVGGGDAAHIGMSAAFVVLSAFAGVVAWSVLFDRDLVCSCFGAASSHRMNGYDLVRNVALMAAAALAWRYAPDHDVLGALAMRPAAISLTFAASGVIVFLLITSLQDIALLLRADAGR